ncbi:MAG: hypothetical protein ACRD32_06865, partial [Nitrososphaerales archaeon]
PYFTGIISDDPNGGPDTGFSNGDTITVKFSAKTNTPFKGINNQLTKANLDALFSFSQNLGTNYDGKWLTSSTLLITIQDATAATPPTIGGLTITVKESASLKNSINTSIASTFSSPPLSGSFGVFTVSIPADVDPTASTVLPAGTKTQVKLGQATSGVVAISRSSLSTIGSGGISLGFVGTVVDIVPPAGACSEGCEFSFILDQEDLNNAQVTLGTLRIFHDKNGDNDVADSGETIVPVILSASSTGPFTLTVKDTSASTFALGAQAASLTVIKKIINDNGGTLSIGQVTLKIDGSQVTNGTVNTVSAGTHTVSETVIPGYTATITGDCAANGSVTLASGESKTCTITNNDISPTLTVIKKIINDNGGNATLSSFTPLQVNSTEITNGTTTSFNAGTYFVTETNADGYGATFSGSCDSAGKVILASGDVKICTITNNDDGATLTVIKKIINDNGGTLSIGQ